MGTQDCPLHKENWYLDGLKWKITFQQKVRLEVQNSIKKVSERPRSKLEDPYTIHFYRGDWPEEPYEIDFFKTSSKKEWYNKPVRNPISLKPWFLQIWGCRSFRSVRMDPSRQVSMDAAYAGLPTATADPNKLNKF